MDIDATKKKSPTPDICYRCGEPGHQKPDCLHRFDICHMTMAEHEEWMQEMVLQKDAEEIAIKEAQLEQEDNRKQDF